MTAVARRVSPTVVAPHFIAGKVFAHMVYFSVR
jgi:hypothetical protein